MNALESVTSTNRLWRCTQCTLALIALCLLIGCPETQSLTSLSQRAMQEDLRQYHDSALKAWAYLDSKRANQGVDISRSRDALLARITNDTTPQQFALLLNEFAASLKDGHSAVFVGAIEPFSYSWPIGFQLVREGVVVANVNSLRDNPGVEVGDWLVKVDGNPIDQYLETRIALTSASTDDARKVIAVDRIGWSMSPGVKLTFAKPDDSVLEAEFQCLPGRIDFRFQKPTEFCTHRNLDDQITVIRIPSFAWNNDAFFADDAPEHREAVLRPAKDQVDEAFSAAEHADGIVLDLRDNSGGLELLSVYVAQHLVAGDFTYYELERRGSEVRKPARPRSWQEYKHYDGKPFEGRLVVLINERCFSTTDNLCAFLRDLRPNTKFVGRPTNGGTGEPAIVDTLSNSGAKIQFCVSRVYSPKGRLIEGAGTRPDVRADNTRDAAIRGEDIALMTALKTLNEW